MDYYDETLLARTDRPRRTRVDSILQEIKNIVDYTIL